MKRILGLCVILMVMSFNVKTIDGVYSISLSEARAATYEECRAKLRKAKRLIKGRGSKNANYKQTDACVRSGGRI